MKKEQTGWTPGPWRWFSTAKPNEDMTRLEYEQDREASGMRFLCGANDQGFAHTVGLDPAIDTANADLIAAAPSLYEALEAIENDGGSIPETIWAMRNAALALARGEGE